MNRILIVGGGPAGINAYNRFTNLKYDTYLFEQSRVLGGHVRKYHPNVLFRDIEGLNPLSAKAYTSLLLSRAQRKTERIFCNAEVKNIMKTETGEFLVYVNNEEKPFKFQKIILATGNGIGRPRKLGFPYEEEADNIFYECSEMEDFKDRHVVLISSGPSTLEFLQDIAQYARHVTIVDRHNDFKENSDAILAMPNVTRYLGHEIADIFIADHHCESVTVTDRKHLLKYEVFCDAVVVNLGVTLELTKFIQKESDSKTLEVDPATCMSSVPGMYVIGDYANYPGKVKRINESIKEIEKVLISIQTSDFDKNS